MTTPPSAAKAFPFPVHQKTLANKLRVVVVPTGLPNLVSLQIPVSTGSRNEVEPGKSGFAHFFEHMMFRGTPTVPKEAWNHALQVTGASQNAYTSDDLTNYHTLCSKQDLEGWIQREADRFQHLTYTEDDFKTEARAVLGEYNKNSSNPVQKLIEVQRDAAFRVHTYKHTTMGFIRDIEDMPNQYAYSKDFFRRWYRPENVSVVLVGDVTPEAGFALVEKHFRAWGAGTGAPPPIPPEPHPGAPVVAHVPWESATLPWVTVAFHGPAFSTEKNDAAALRLAGEILFGKQSDVYQRLVVREQKVNALWTFGGANKDPGLFTVAAQVKDIADLAYVRDTVLDAFARGRALPFSPERVDDAKREARLELLRSLDSTQSIADLVARFTSYDRDPDALEKALRLRDSLTAADLSRVARDTFRDSARVITTLAHGPLPAGMGGDVAGVEARASRLLDVPKLAFVEEPNSASPLVDVRITFGVGSTSDPAGKEGLAALSVAMLANGGSRGRGITELTKAYAATGASLGSRADKDQLGFSLSVPKETAPAAIALALEQITEPGFRPEDFTRLRSQQLNALKVGLKANNDEELGKLALEARIFGEPFAHPVLGHEGALSALTLEDVKAFVKSHLTRASLRVGLGGSYAQELKAELLRGLATLPDAKVAASPLAPVAKRTASRLLVVTKETRSTAISFGYDLPVDRRHADFAALWVAASHLGQHRNSTGVLYQRIRELRGLNYGDYAYVEPFPNGMFLLQPDPGYLRRQNHFQIWIRPVVPKNGAFALKLALVELRKLVKDGLSKEAFEATRTYLSKFLDHLTDTGSKRLGHDMDMSALGFDHGYAEALKAKLSALTLADVNAAIRRHLRADRLDIVAITKDAEAFRRDLFADGSPVPTYDSAKPQISTEDAAVARTKVDLTEKDVTVVPLEQLFH